MPVFPTQIEKVLLSNEALESACAVAIPHPYRMHVVKAYLLLKDKSADENTKKKIKEELEKACETELIPYARPVEYEFRDEFPLTKLGKIDYRELEKIASGEKNG